MAPPGYSPLLRRTERRQPIRGGAIVANPVRAAQGERTLRPARRAARRAAAARHVGAGRKGRLAGHFRGGRGPLVLVAIELREQAPQLRVVARGFADPLRDRLERGARGVIAAGAIVADG